MSTRVLLDCRFRKGAGPNVATRYLLDHLVRLNTAYELVILQHRDQHLPDYPGVPNVFVPSGNPMAEFAWIQLALPRLLERYRIDVCHSLKHVGPLFAGAPTVLHVHEVNHLLPEGDAGFDLDFAHRVYWNHVLVWGLRRATRVITLTAQSQQVLTEHLGLPHEKVSVVPYGLGPVFGSVRNDSQMRDCRRRYRLPERYLLCVGSLCPQENYVSVVKMLARLRARQPDAPAVVIAGDTGDADVEVSHTIDRLDLRPHIVFTGFVPHDDLVHLYHGALLLLFPPVVATFSTPPLEAMACGLPVVASNLAGTAEVTRGAAYLFDTPTDDDAMCRAVRRVLSDEPLRHELREKGLRRARDFSWDASARKVLELYGTTAAAERSAPGGVTAGRARPTIGKD